MKTEDYLFPVTLIVFSAIGVVATVIEIGGLGLVTPTGVLISTSLAMVYLAVVVLVFSRLCIWPKGTPLWWLSALVWGAGTSMFVVLAVSKPMEKIVNGMGWFHAEASLGGAYPEELTKALGVVVVLAVYSCLCKPWYGFIVGALVGAGFEAVENILYGASGAIEHAVSDTSGAIFSWVMRMVLGPFLHICCTAITGWGIGLAMYAIGLSTAGRWLRVVLWWGVAVAIHFSWNYTNQSDVVAALRMGITAVVMYAVTILILLRARKAVTQSGSAMPA